MSGRATILVGGNSRLARAMLARDPMLRTISRGACPGNSNQIVARYHDIQPAMLEGAETIVHMAGAVQGSPELLAEANSILTAHIARIAREAGVRRMIHISSFSLFGGCPLVRRDTMAAPQSHYGHSKWAAEQALLAASGGTLHTLSLRLPSLYDEDSGKLVQMVRFGTRRGLWLTPGHDVQRSFLSYRLAAEVIGRLVAAPFAAADGGADGGTGAWPDWLAAADPTPFSYHLGKQAIAAATGRSPLSIPTAIAQSMLARLAPGLHHSLFEDSLLNADANIAADLSSTLYADMQAMARAALGAP